MANVLEKEWNSYFAQLDEAEKKSVLQMLKTFLTGRKNEPRPQSLKAYNHELEQADAEIEGGDYVSHKEVMKRYRKRQSA